MPLNKVTADSIQDGTVVASDIADGTITLAKLQSGLLPPAIANSAASYANSGFTHANSGFAVANTDVTGITTTAGAYGNSTVIPTITIAANGRITAISNNTVVTDQTPQILMLAGM
jgi:hypothetical protein